MLRAFPRLTLLAALLAAGTARAAVHIVSYDAADDVTRRTAGGLTFEYDRGLIFTRVLRVRSTEGEARADLKPANDEVLGHGGLTGILGPDARERDLYEVKPTAEGGDMIRAFCPGSTRAWLAFGRIAQYRGLRVRVLGNGGAGGKARLCQTLDFSWRGEWKLPAGQSVHDRDLKTPTFPF
jgi:hypothetical protein